MSKLTREGFRAMHEQAAEALERSIAAIAPPIAEVMWSYPGATSVTSGPST